MKHLRKFKDGRVVHRTTCWHEDLRPGEIRVQVSEPDDESIREWLVMTKEEYGALLCKQRLPLTKS